jgi:hypothetical protein
MEAERLAQTYAVLIQRILSELRKYESLPDSSAAREAHVHHVITSIEFALEELAPSSKPGARDEGNGLLPAMPDPLVEIPLFEEVKRELLEKIRLGDNQPILLEGENGLGKSLLAAALASDLEIARHFDDGVLWLRLGRHADLLGAQHRLIRQLGGKLEIGFVESEEATVYLQEALATRACLLVLDDIWEIEDIGALNVAGPRCHWIITTANPELPGFVSYLAQKTKAWKMPGLAQKPAIKYFLHHAGQAGMNQVPAAVVRIVEFCQGHPLALHLAASSLINQAKPDWAGLLARLQQTDNEFSSHYFPYLLQSLQICIEELGEEADYYLVLAVFPVYSRIPRNVVLMLWQHMFQLQDKSAADLLAQYQAKGLLQAYQSEGRDYLALHRCQYDYMLDYAELDKLHPHLLAAYRRQCPQGWVRGPDDGYFLEYLAWHLAHARRYAEFKTLLLDFDWIARCLASAPLYALLEDYLLIKDPDLERVHHALFGAVPALSRDRGNLAHELLDRLWEKASKDLQGLLNQAKEIEPDWRPQFREPGSGARH